MKDDSVYNRIKIFRQKAGATQEEVAMAVGVSRQTIIAIERGNYIPSVMVAMRLSAYFRARVEELFSLSKDQYKM